MWSCVVSGVGGDVPGARHKHAVCLCYPHVYLFGGRQGNFPLKDFWLYDLGCRSWHEVVDDKGQRPPSLQQHTMIPSPHGKILVFGGELCMSNETPLWIYDLQEKSWRKWRRKEGISIATRARGTVSPSGRRGHSAVLFGDRMLIYGGYQDLHGSTSELWAFHIGDESWKLLCPARGEQPPSRHAHSAVVHDGFMWVYGGMTDLQERSDFWKYDIACNIWTQVRARPNPGCLHSHVAVRLHSAMIVFGGERQGEMLSELWRFHFSTCTWERLIPAGMKPQPRSQFCAFVAPSHMLKYTNFAPQSGFGSTTCSSRSSHSSGYSSKSSDSYKTRRVHPDLNGKPESNVQNNGHQTEHAKCGCGDCDSSDDEIDPHRLRSVIQRNCVNANPNNLKVSISKISQLNLSHLGRYYSYSILSNDSTESIIEESLASTCESTVSKMIKSQSSLVLKDNIKQQTVMSSLPRDTFSVPNFSEVEDDISDAPLSKREEYKLNSIHVLPADASPDQFDEDAQDFMSRIRGHLSFADDHLRSADTSISENLMSFSCTESSLNSEAFLNSNCNISFINPNYIDEGKDEGILSKDYWKTGVFDLETARHKEFAEILKTPPDSGIGLGVELEGRSSVDVKLDTLEDFVSFNDVTTNFAKHGKGEGQGKSCANGNSEGCGEKNRHGTGTRVTFSPHTGGGGGGNEKSHDGKPEKGDSGKRDKYKEDKFSDQQGPFAMYIVGGKETGEMTVFKRPISIWKLDMPY